MFKKRLFAAFMCVLLLAALQPGAAVAANASPAQALADALVNAEAHGDTVTLTDNVQLTNTVNIAGGTITLDLKGFTITGQAGADGAEDADGSNGLTAMIVRGSANLTLKDSSDPKTGVIVGGAGGSVRGSAGFLGGMGGHALSVKDGTFTMDGGSVRGGAGGSSEEIAQGGFGGSGLFICGGTVNSIVNGSFTGGSGDMGGDGLYFDSGTLHTISGGSFTGGFGLMYGGNGFAFYAQDQTAAVAGGTFTGGNSNSVDSNYGIGLYKSDLTTLSVTISGGVFRGGDQGKALRNISSFAAGSTAKIGNSENLTIDWDGTDDLNSFRYVTVAPPTYTVTLDGQRATAQADTSVTAAYNSPMPPITPPERVYTATYHYNGATGGNGRASDSTVRTFTGYFDAVSGGKKYYNADGSSASNWDKMSGATLYAAWANGTSFILPEPTRTDYAFGGWYSDPSLSDQSSVGGGGDSCTITIDTGLYAKWIAPPQLTVSGTTADGKAYDGTTAAVITLGTVTGVAPGDDVAVTPSGHFADKNAGTNKEVTVTYALSGADAGKYIAPADDICRADISPLAVQFSGLAARNGSDTETTTTLTITLDAAIPGLTLDALTLTGADKLALASGSTANEYYLGIDHITVPDKGAVNVAIADPNYTFTPAGRDAEVRVYAPKTNATISPATANYDKHTALSGLLFTLNPGSYALSEIRNGAAALTASDYAVSGNVYAIGKAYLDKQPIGTLTLTFKMSGGISPTATITLSDSTPIHYDIIAGQNGRYTKPDKNGLSFTANGDYSKFNGVATDKHVLSDDLYLSMRGSTIIILKPDYLSSLTAGQHTLRVNFTDGYAETRFTVVDTPPLTGDFERPLLWACALAAAGLALVILIARRNRQG